MIIGDPSIFAIESSITTIVDKNSSQALGYFVIHIEGTAYGVREADATMLGCSYDEILSRLKRAGDHQFPLLTGQSGNDAAQAYLDCIYRDTLREDYFGLSRDEFSHLINENRIQWAPDGDEAFDDGSHVLQFDEEGRVRLVGFKNVEPHLELSRALKDVWLDAETFYGVLSTWSNAYADQTRGILTGLNSN